MDKLFKLFPHADYAQKFSYSVVYAILASIGVNFFYQPGQIYSSGITGVAQILTTLSEDLIGVHVPVSATLLLLNLPLFLLGWFKIGHKFTIFTGITVVLTSLFMQIMPEETLTTDPIICAIFGGAIMGAGVGYTLKSGLSSGGLDFVSIAIRKKTGKTIGSISITFNLLIMIAAGLLFGWKYALYSAIAIFVSGKVTDAVYTKQKKMQVIIITRHPEKVIHNIQKKLRRGITIINEAEGAYKHDKQTVLLTVVTRFELPMLREAMKSADSHAFVSIADNVQILGRFYEEDF
ncbi:YitT family protein [Enterococcus diestrammenae]|uniref:YitT family protein n=1 Tax=Enterococcus diestrammenae TaxID=1155073 RepID=UPI0022E4448E|nr:YitT family protein [Enterococcus diestrammenae]